jgi:hypothetical protein
MLDDVISLIDVAHLPILTPSQHARRNKRPPRRDELDCFFKHREIEARRDVSSDT